MKANWTFTEEQRDSVCKGERCPACGGSNIKGVGSNPTPTEINAAYDCQDCGEQWEGY